MDNPNFDISQVLDDDEDEGIGQGVEVISPSGTKFIVMNQQEADFYNTMVERYDVDNKLKNVSDFLELDRIVVMELMSYRWSTWITTGQDYAGKKINASEVQKSINMYSKEIREIKRDLGIDKNTRDKDKGADIAEYIHMLGIRAKEFGVYRNEQAISAITMLKDIFAKCTGNKNSNPAEQREFGLTSDHIIDYILSQKEEFDKIQEVFDKQQKMWIRDLQQDVKK